MKKAFPQRLWLARMTRHPLIGALTNLSLFAGDERQKRSNTPACAEKRAWYMLSGATSWM
jgi:hypothetical protein